MKMANGSIACEISVASDFIYVSNVPCNYAKETIAYAVKRFFTHCGKLRRECTVESWQYRIVKGKAKKRSAFRYLIPAVLMELPGEWVRITGTIDAAGVEVQKVETLRELPELLPVRL